MKRRYKTIVYEEVTVYRVTYKEWVPPEPAYDGGDGPGSCWPATPGFYRTTTKRGLSLNKKDKLVRELGRGSSHRGVPTVTSSKTWRKISEDISTRKPKSVARKMAPSLVSVDGYE